MHRNNWMDRGLGGSVASGVRRQRRGESPKRSRSETPSGYLGSPRSTLVWSWGSMCCKVAVMLAWSYRFGGGGTMREGSYAELSEQLGGRDFVDGNYNAVTFEGEEVAVVGFGSPDGGQMVDCNLVIGLVFWGMGWFRWLSARRPAWAAKVPPTEP